MVLMFTLASLVSIVQKKAVIFILIGRLIPVSILNVAGWLKTAPLPDWMKPDNAKVLVVFDKLQWRDLSVDLAVPIGKRIPPRALKWLQKFAEDNMRPLIYTEQAIEKGVFSRQQIMTGYGPVDFQQDVAQWAQSGKSFW